MQKRKNPFHSLFQYLKRSARADHQKREEMQNTKPQNTALRNKVVEEAQLTLLFFPCIDGTWGEGVTAGVADGNCLLV